MTADIINYRKVLYIVEQPVNGEIAHVDVFFGRAEGVGAFVLRVRTLCICIRVMCSRTPEGAGFDYHISESDMGQTKSASDQHAITKQIFYLVGMCVG